MLPKKPEASGSEADNVQRHTEQENKVSNRVVHQMAIVVKN